MSEKSPIFLPDEWVVEWQMIPLPPRGWFWERISNPNGWRLVPVDINERVKYVF